MEQWPTSQVYIRNGKPRNAGPKLLEVLYGCIQTEDVPTDEIDMKFKK